MTRTGRQSEVDETLFGSSSSSGARRTKKSQISTPGAIVISKDELDRIKRNAAFSSNSSSNLDEQDRIMKLEKAKARSEKIRQLQAASLVREQQSADNSDEVLRANAIREVAQAKMESTSEVVKLLTTMSARAAAFTMREQQVAEKHRRDALERDYEQRMDILMEIERLKEITRREHEEKQKVHQRQEDRKVIVEQIEDRRRIQILAAEAREQENQQMRDLVKKYEENDKLAAERKRFEVEKSRTEVLRANQAAIQKKIDSKSDARREVEEILAYQLKRDMEMKRREDEEAALALAKRIRAKQLLDEQERVMNNQDKRDETMARRFAEEKERNERNKEKEARLKKQRDMELLVQSREMAAEHKRQQELVEKQMELLSIEAQNRHAAVLDAREAEVARAKREATLKHRQGIMEQVQLSEAQKKLQMAEKFAEGERLKEKERREMAQFEAVKDKMIRDLARQGVETKFLTEMQALNLKKLIYKS